MDKSKAPARLGTIATDNMLERIANLEAEAACMCRRAKAIDTEIKALAADTPPRSVNEGWSIRVGRHYIALMRRGTDGVPRTICTINKHGLTPFTRSEDSLDGIATTGSGIAVVPY